MGKKIGFIIGLFFFLSGETIFGQKEKLLFDTGLLEDDPEKEWCYLKKSTTVIGYPFHPDVTEVTYDGSLYTGYAELCFGYGKEDKPLLARQKTFRDGWIPIVEYEWKEDLQYRIELFSSPLKDTAVANCINFIRVSLTNSTDQPDMAFFSVGTRGRSADYRLASLKEFSSESRFIFTESGLLRDKKLIFSFPSEHASLYALNKEPYDDSFTVQEKGIEPHIRTGIVRYKKELKPGETWELVFKMPRVPVPVSDQKQVREIEQASYSLFAEKTELYWRQMITGKSQIRIPEKRIEQAYKASIAHLLLATRTKPDGVMTQTDGIPYPDFFLTSAPQMVMAYLTAGLNEPALLSIRNAVRQQEEDGLYFDRSLAHAGIIPAAHGHVLYMLSSYYLFTRDKETGRLLLPSLNKAIKYLERVTGENEYGLLPPTYPYDNEMIDGHYASNNYWALLGLRYCIRMAQDLGENDLAAKWLTLEKRCRQSILKGIQISAHADGYVPPGLYPYLTGKKARRGFEEYQTHCDWENMLLAYPTELVEPDSPYLSGTLNRVRKGYAEGIMTYRHGMHLHQYITANLIEQYMVGGNPKQALIDFYHLILHAGSTHEGFENLVIPWKDRMVDPHCPPPHAWASGKTAFLIRNFLIHEYGGQGGIEEGRNLHLFSVLSPEWTKPGDTIALSNVPTEMGTIDASFIFSEGKARIDFNAAFHSLPASIKVVIPYFKKLKDFRTDASFSVVKEGCLIVSPDFTRIDFVWEDLSDAHRGTTEQLLEAYRACNNYRGFDPQTGFPIIEEGKAFLLAHEEKNRYEPLNFELIKQTFLYEFDRRTKLSSFLQSLQGEYSSQLYRYEKNRLISGIRLQEGISGSEKEALWHVQTEVRQDMSQPEALDLNFTFQLEKGELKSSGVGVEFQFAGWDPENYVLAPAAVYDGNRFRILPVGYPPYIYKKEDKPLDMPVTITQVPHLSREHQSSEIKLLTGNCSTPMVAFYDPRKGRGFILLTTQQTDRGNSGFVIREDPETGTASFILTAPGVREKRYVMTSLVDSEDQAPDWKAGDDISIRLKIYNVEAKSLQDFYERIFDVRKAVTGANEYRTVAPFSAIKDLILAHHDRNKWYDDGKYAYICNQPKGNSPFGHVQTGWSGIPAYTYPQVLQSTPLRTERVVKSFEYLSTLTGRSGLIYGMSKKGELFGDNFDEMTLKRSVALVRRSGLVLYLGLQQYSLLKEQVPDFDTTKAIEKMFVSIADGLVHLFHTYGEFGQFVDVETGEMDINGSTGAAICIGALAQASVWFNDPDYLDIAEKAADFYLINHLEKGYSGGGPAEILQAPDSESTAELAESFITLYEMTGKQKWLDAACFATYLFSTWVVSYDYLFPAGSDMYRVGAKSTGSVWASIQNAHSAPGIYILSGDFLLKLYRATGDRRFMELLKDIVHNVVQYTTTEKNPIGRGSLPGSVSERVNLSDWEGKEGIGMVSPGDSNMAWETVTLLSIMQNPGIYLVTDDDYMVVFDHIEARVVSRTKEKIILEIENKNSSDAEVAVFAESKVEQQIPLGYKASLSWPVLQVKAGEKKEFAIPVK